MATGDKILTSWIDKVWKSFNDVISKYSNGLSQLKAHKEIASADDFEKLNEKIKQIKSDYYLKSEAVLFASFYAPQNGLITENFRKSVDENINKFSVLKCKNVATYLYGTHEHSNNPHGSKANTPKSGNGTNSYGITANSHAGNSKHQTIKDGRGTYQHTLCSKGTNSHGEYSNGPCSNTQRSHGTVVQLRNTNTTTTRG